MNSASQSAESKSRTALLGDSPEQLQSFYDYLQAFSAGEIDRFSAFYTENIVFDLGVAPPFHGRSAVVAFYSTVFKNIREQVTVKTLTATPDAILASISVLFTAFHDMPDFVLKPLAAGDTLVADFDIVYGLTDGLISTVKVQMSSEHTAGYLTAGG